MNIEIEYDQYELQLEVKATKTDLRGGGYPINFDIEIDNIEILAALNEDAEWTGRALAVELLGEFLALDDSAEKIIKAIEAL